MRSNYTGLGLTGIQYNQNKEIESFKIGEFEEGEAFLDTFFSVTREELIETQLEEDPTHIQTMFEKDGLWADGQKIHVFQGKTGFFIRIDKNKIEEDHLGELPEFKQM